MSTLEDSKEFETNPSDLNSQADFLRYESTEQKDKITAPPSRIVDLESRVIDLECKNKIHEAEEVMKKEFSKERNWYIGVIISLIIALAVILSHFL